GRGNCSTGTRAGPAKHDGSVVCSDERVDVDVPRAVALVLPPGELGTFFRKGSPAEAFQRPNGPTVLSIGCTCPKMPRSVFRDRTASLSSLYELPVEFWDTMSRSEYPSSLKSPTATGVIRSSW